MREGFALIFPCVLYPYPCGIQTMFSFRNPCYDMELFKQLQVHPRKCQFIHGNFHLIPLFPSGLEIQTKFQASFFNPALSFSHFLSP